MRNVRHIALSGLLSAVVVFALPALAAPARSASNPHENVLQLVQSNGLTLSEAVAQVRRKYNGRIVSAETRVRGNREMHYIKVLTKDGKVITERIPGRTRGGRG